MPSSGMRSCALWVPLPVMKRMLASCRALVLDSSYRPIDVINWQRAICLDLFDKVRLNGACTGRWFCN